MKKLICFFTIFVFWGITDSMAQGLHFGVKAGVLGNKANISGMRDQFKEESLTGFQVGPMLQYQTGFHGIALDFSLLYVERGIKLTNTSNRRSADIKTQSIDIPIELKWEMGISNNFDLFLGVGPSFSFLVDKDNWGRKLAHACERANTRYCEQEYWILRWHRSSYGSAAARSRGCRQDRGMRTVVEDYNNSVSKRKNLLLGRE